MTAKELKKHKKAIQFKEFKYTKWEEYFRLQPRDYFGGRVLFSHQIESRDEKSDNEAGGTTQIAPSMLTVMADSSEVEVLIMDKTNWSFFPENIQKEILTKLQRKISVERPYEQDFLEFVKELFTQWDQDKFKVYLQNVKDNHTKKQQNKAF